LVFSSPSFLFVFLPLLLLAYYSTAGIASKNLVLLAASLLFYAWGEPACAWVLVATWAFSWAWALGMARLEGPARRAAAWLGCLALAGELIYFKTWAGHLPLGISFFVFQALSYLLDVQSALVPAEPSLFRFALYKSFFPQLIAGPIVRYAQMKDQLTARTHDWSRFSQGALRFTQGLAKKTLLADSLGQVADRLWPLQSESLSPALVGTALLTYGLQIYFDFSGYSDMACGLAQLFGFSFPENFNHPYTARSVRDFWRRWHMTLSAWFRDYVYVPLGGGRLGPWRSALNLWAVFLLCGLWHGCSWNFLLWGAWFGLFLSLEHFLAPRLGSGAPPALAWLYTQTVVFGGWLLFRSPDLATVGKLLRALVSTPGIYALPLPYFLQPVHLFIIAAALGLAAGWWPRLQAWATANFGDAGTAFLDTGCGGLALLLAWARLSSQAYQSFMYFRF
jgi:alginate O-acetyltransferase complex protein AlgI